MTSTIEDVNIALLAAFDHDGLSRMVKYGLDESLDSVARGRDLTAVVFRLTDWAERQGKLSELVEAAKENTKNPKVHGLEISEPRGAEQEQRISSGAVVTNLELIDYRLSQLQAEVESLKKIVTGPDGDNGIRQMSMENRRQVELIRSTVDRLESAMMTGPNLLASKSSRVVFGVIITVLVVNFGLITAGAFGWL